MAPKLAERLSAEVEAGARRPGRDEVGGRERRLYLSYAGADAALPAPWATSSAVKAAFDAAHRRLFGFVEPELPILIASVEAEVSEVPLPAAGRGQGCG